MMLTAAKCFQKKCLAPSANAFPCQFPTCQKAICQSCFTAVVLTKNQLDAFENKDGSTVVVCSKRHYNSCKKAITDLEKKQKKEPSNRWDQDGPLGRDDPNHSESIVIGWLTDEGNYRKYRGSDNKGLRKTEFAEKIAKIINCTGVKIKRDAKMVVNKIASLEGAFRRAHDFANHETGAGKEVTDTGKTFEDVVTGKFKYYYEMLEIMADRAGGRATRNTDNLDDLELTSGERALLGQPGDEIEDDEVVNDEEDDYSDDYSSPPSPDLEGAASNQPTAATTVQWDGEMGHQPVYAAMPYNVPVAASVVPASLRYSRNDIFDHSDDTDNDETGTNKGKRSVPFVGDDDDDKKPKAKSQRSNKKFPPPITEDVEDEDGNIDVLGGYRDAKGTGKNTLAGKAKAAVASASGSKKQIKQSASSTSKARKPKNADAMMADSQEESNRSMQRMIEEKKRHNQQKEAASQQKEAARQQQKEAARQQKDDVRQRRAEQREQSSAMSYNMKLYDNYMKLKADGMLPDKIIELFPDMKKFI
jgi:hypothetical protein